MTDPRQEALSEQRARRTFPSDQIGSGWYVIGWSTDFTVGEVKPLSYFDTELIAFRGESGDLHVLDAYCRHMGAHLGYGGCVEGDSIRCPYHGWAYDGDGRNVDIPYSKPDKMGNLRLKQWNIREIDGIVVAYYSSDESPPTYELPERLVRYDGDSWPVSPATTKTWLDQPVSPQFMAENAADAAHFKYVHRSNEVADIASYGAAVGVFHSRINIRFGGGVGSTWATPNGPVDGTITNENWGLGIGWSHLQGFDDVTFCLGITPITARTADMRSTTWVARKRADGSDMDEETRDRWVAQQNAQIDADLVIWKRMSYAEKVPWAKSEQAAMRDLRQWADQFYRTCSR
jgi:3-ketosteroid 9alpha-monooxygenase subunit A